MPHSWAWDFFMVCAGLGILSFPSLFVLEAWAMYKNG